jgi:conjugal transfer mating pair stabilization protein TraG
LARSIATDAQTGTREVASLGLQGQDVSSLQKTASDSVSASQTYNQAASAQSRFGVSASYGAAETGQRIAGNQKLLSSLDTALDRFGLRGDAQRLGSEWRVSGLITDKEQAYAAAGMSLLVGYSSPLYRQLDEHDTKLAKAEGFQLLGDAFDAPRSIQSPDAYAGLVSQAPELGAVQSKINHTGFNDPRDDAQGLHVRAGNRIHATGESVSTGEHRVHEARQVGLRQLNGAADEGFGNMDADKSGYFLAEIRRAAHGPQSAAEIQYDLLGGAVYTTAKAMGISKEYASGSFSGFVKAFESARSDGKSMGEAFISALDTVPEDGKKAVRLWVDQQVEKMQGRLTPTQLAFYRESIFESFAGVSIYGSYGGDSGPIRQQLLKEHGSEVGADIAELLKQAASQNRGDLAGLVGQYSQAMEGVEVFPQTPPNIKKR